MSRSLPSVRRKRPNHMRGFLATFALLSCSAAFAQTTLYGQLRKAAEELGSKITYESVGTSFEGSLGGKQFMVMLSHIVDVPYDPAYVVALRLKPQRVISVAEFASNLRPPGEARLLIDGTVRFQLYSNNPSTTTDAILQRLGEVPQWIKWFEDCFGPAASVPVMNAQGVPAIYDPERLVRTIDDADLHLLPGAFGIEDNRGFNGTGRIWPAPVKVGEVSMDLCLVTGTDLKILIRDVPQGFKPPKETYLWDPEPTYLRYFTQDGKLFVESRLSLRGGATLGAIYQWILDTAEDAEKNVFKHKNN
jgi:hypothetical protein